MSEVEDASILGSNLSAVEAISGKLAEITLLAEKLDARLCEAGAKTRSMPITTSVTSSTSSLFSTPVISSSATATHTVSTEVESVLASTVVTSVPVAVQVHVASCEIASTATSLLTTSTATIEQHHSQPTTSIQECMVSTGIVTSNVSIDAAPLTTSMSKDSIESSFNIRSHSTENLSTSNSDSNTKVH